MCLLNACNGGGGGTQPVTVATQFSVTGQPIIATAGAAFNITVNALDASNNVVSSYSGTVHFGSTDGQAALPADSRLTNGTRTFSVTLKTAGSQIIAVADTVTAIAGTSSSINVSATATAQFSVSGPPSATAGSAFSFTVAARDPFNNVTSGYSGTVKFTSTDGQAVLPANSGLTNGMGTFTVALITDGPQTIKATDTGTASIFGTSNSINVSGVAATNFLVSAPNSATAGTAFSFTVTARDASNNVVTSYSGTVHFTSTDPQANLPPNSMLSSGTATFPAGLKTAGSRTIKAADTFITSIFGTSNSINVSGAAAANPVPLIDQPLRPDAVVSGGMGFPGTLTVNGTGFVSGAMVHWNGSARATQFVGESKLTATVLPADIANFNTASVTVVNPAPGGGTSNVVFFETTRPTSSLALRSPSGYAAGTAPGFVAVGDFNGDGKLDMVVANSSSNNVSILLGNGDGTFQAAVNYSVGTDPDFVAVGDFNGDGKLDLAVANANSNNVSILLGNGDGTFRPSVNFTVGSEPSSVVVGDFNGDGKLDLVVANVQSNNVSVLLGNGDGTFQTALHYSTAVFPSSVAVGDFNGDGRLDLAVANFGTESVSILLGNGDGTFQPAVNYGAGFPPSHLAVGDFNGDGVLDLAVADITNTGPSNVSVLLGNGDGTFQPAVGYGAGSNNDFASVAVGDFNGDGKLDLVVAHAGSNATNNVSILLGNGDGTFQPAVNYGTGSNPSVAVGDFNGDGRLDIAVVDHFASTVSVLLQPGLVTGPNAVLSPTSLTFATQLVGNTSPAQPILLNNYGTETLNITSIAATNNFAETNTCGSSLLAGAGCTINITFKPSAVANVAGTLSVTDNAPGSSQTASLNGTVTVVTLTPASLHFMCSLRPGGVCNCGRPQETARLTNTGSTTLSITGVTITGPFSLRNTCGTSLGAGQSCDLDVGWSETNSSGLLSVFDNGGGSPQTVSLNGLVECHP